MKTKLTLTLIAVALSYQANAQISVTDLGQSAQFGHISAVDFDNDGDLDLVVGGEDGGNNVQMYTNNGFGVYAVKTSPLTALARPSFDWNDVNQDGVPDLINNGFGPFAGIYTNDGTGALTLSTIALPQIAPNSGFADLNNDGFVDIFIFGNDNTGKSKILFNNKLGGFTESNQFASYKFVDPQISVVDFDNDKDLDLFVTAGFEDGDNIGKRFSSIFVNNGSGVFTAQLPTSTNGFFPRGNGSSVWGDYDADGLPDLLINGDGGIGSGDNADNYRLYKNNGGGSFTSIRTFDYRQNMTGGGGAFLDWDNDGDLDIVVTGWSGTRQSTDVFLNTTGTFTAYANNASIPGSSEGSVEIGDANGDGLLDLFISGYSNNDWDGVGTVAPYNRNIAVIALNPNVTINTAPTAPTGLAVTGNSVQLNFAWSAATDATTPQNALTYNFYLKDAINKWFYTPLSNIANGKTKTAKVGNVQQNKGWIVKGLPDGTYTWGVQAVDNSYVGSTFTSGTFVVASGVLPIKIGEYKAFADGNNAVIKWQSLSEVNTSHYLVERSTDGITFNEIATVSATGGNNSIQDYLIRDKTPTNGTNYYRLTSIDKDSKTQTFDVLAVKFSLAEAVIAAYPNPLTSSVLKIKVTGFKADKITATLSSINGQTIYSEVINIATGDGIYELQLAKKPAPGIYSLSLSSSQFERNIKIVVQ
jgi:hypothetical protein